MVAAAAVGQPVQGADSAALALMGRMLDNIRREPVAPRFRKVRGPDAVGWSLTVLTS